jgi:hypothetical protein
MWRVVASAMSLRGQLTLPLSEGDMGGSRRAGSTTSGEVPGSKRSGKGVSVSSPCRGRPPLGTRPSDMDLRGWLRGSVRFRAACTLLLKLRMATFERSPLGVRDEEVLAISAGVWPP